MIVTFYTFYIYFKSFRNKLEIWQRSRKFFTREIIFQYNLEYNIRRQKQSLRKVLSDMFSKKVLKIHRKTLMIQSYFCKASGFWNFSYKKFSYLKGLHRKCFDVSLATPINRCSLILIKETNSLAVFFPNHAIVSRNSCYQCYYFQDLHLK